MHLLGLGEGFAVSTVADDVIAREPLDLVQLRRLQHPQADIYDHVRRAFDGDGDQCQAVALSNSGIRCCMLWNQGEFLSGIFLVPSMAGRHLLT